MNNAHIESKAVPGQRQGVPALVRRLAACCLIGVAAMGAAHAGPRERERERERDAQDQRGTVRAERQPQRQPEQRQPYERQARQYDARAYDTRSYEPRSYDPRAEDPRRNRQNQEQQSPEASRRNGRLTPDERRDLRRQINEAGADIYPSRSHR